MGRYVQFGVFPDKVTADWNIIGDTKELDIRGSHLGAYCYPAVIEGITTGKIPTDGVVSHTFKLSEWKKAFDTAEKDPDAFKVVLILDCSMPQNGNNGIIKTLLYTDTEGLS
jgi:L-iditol 2-dehydrogenase